MGNLSLSTICHSVFNHRCVSCSSWDRLNGRDGQENIWRLAFWTVAGGEGWRAQPLEGCKTDLILKVAVVSKWMAGSDWLDASWVVQEFSFFLQRTFCKNSTNNCQSVEIHIGEPSRPDMAVRSCFLHQRWQRVTLHQHWESESKWVRLWIDVGVECRETREARHQCERLIRVLLRTVSCYFPVACVTLV